LQEKGFCILLYPYIKAASSINIAQKTAPLSTSQRWSLYLSTAACWPYN